MTESIDPVIANRCNARCWIGDDQRVWCMLDVGHEGRHAVWEAERYRIEWGDGWTHLFL